MNRFEALNVLNLDESATDDDVRLAYYGLDRAVKSLDFSDSERLALRITSYQDRSKEARDYLLANGIGPTKRTGGVVGGAFRRKPRREKLSITRERELEARLQGYERLRVCLLGYRDHEMSHRLTCFIVLLVCIVLGFVILRYLRMMPRAVAFGVVVVIAVAGSTGFTSAHLQCRTAKRHLLAVDDEIHQIRVALGLDPEDEEDPDESACGEHDATVSPNTGLTCIDVEFDDDENDDRDRDEDDGPDSDRDRDDMRDEDMPRQEARR